MGGFALGFLAAHWPGVGRRRLAGTGRCRRPCRPRSASSLFGFSAFGCDGSTLSEADRSSELDATCRFFSVGSMSRLTRAGLLDVKHSPFYRTALAKGRSHLAALCSGRARRTLTLIAGWRRTGRVVGGTAVTEIVFEFQAVERGSGRVPSRLRDHSTLRRPRRALGDLRSRGRPAPAPDS